MLDITVFRAGDVQHLLFGALSAQIRCLDLLICQQLSAGAGERQVAGLQHIGVVRYLQRHVGVLLVQQHRDALLVDRADDVEDLPHHNGGKAKARLGQQQQPGLAQQGTAYGQHLLLAAGEGACALPAALLQPGNRLYD